MPDHPLPCSVCIVTHEFVGLPGSGGIGTAFAGLAQALADTGHQVTVLCSGLLPVPDDFVAGAGITVVCLPDAPVRVEGDRFLRLSHDVFLWLAARQFDVVHFADWTGLGFCTTAAKRQGLAFANTTLAVGLHGPTRWVRSATGGGLEGPEELAVDFLERRSIEWADVAISPSIYLIDWLRRSGMALPARTEQRQNLLPSLPSDAPCKVSGAVRDLVFFGRLETRKGVRLFCDALDRLAADGGNGISDAALRITFLGNSAPVDGEDGTAYARRRSLAWPWPVTFRHGLSSAEALDHLAGEGRLAVIPSLIENSPCTVAECLIRGLPLLASHVGGTAELVAEEDVDRILFAPEARALADRLREVLRTGAKPARLRVPQTAVADEWRAWHTAEAACPRPDSDERTADSTAGYRLMVEPSLRLLDGAAERMAAVAARTGAALVSGAVDEAGGARRWLALGGPAALAPWADIIGCGPLLVRADLAEEHPIRLLLGGHRLVVMPVAVATIDTAPPLRPTGERVAPLLSREAGDVVGDLARLTLGLEARIARSTAEVACLKAECEVTQTAWSGLQVERNRLAGLLEETSASGEAEQWRGRLNGLLESRSWTLTTVLRRRFGGVDEVRLAALPADRAVEAVLASVWWDLTAPLRVVARLVSRLRR